MFKGTLFRSAAICLAGLMPALAAAATYEVLQEFVVPGAQPLAPLVLAADGNFYGTTVSGGSFGLGQVFRVTPAGAMTAVVSFTGTTGTAPGAAPVAGLTVGPDGLLYGTTSAGGADGFGTIFRLAANGALTSLVGFTGSSGAARGSVPQQMVSHADGFLYGVTQGGGTAGSGTVFRCSIAGGLTTLLDFSGGTGPVPGAGPVGVLAVQGATLYGMTEAGGAGGFGTIFKVTTAGAWSLMAEFTGTAGIRAGAGPTAGLHLHSDGNLYGTTASGGTSDLGTAFKLTTSASPVYTVLRHFVDATGCQPAGTLVRDGAGVLYGVTSGGGSAGLGTVFKMTTAGVHTVLASLSGTSGSAPQAGLIFGSDGALYGLGSAGGRGNRGAVFRITTGGVLTSLTDFGNASGWFPAGPPVADGNAGFLFPMAQGGVLGGGTLARWQSGGGVSVVAAFGDTLGEWPVGALLKTGNEFIGLAARGGASARGTAFRYQAGTGATAVSQFTVTSGSLAQGGLTVGTDGLFYGTAAEGGTSGRGTIFKMTSAGVRTRLISFTGTAGAAKGQAPLGPLVLAADGSFYGVTERGGAADVGTIFRLNALGVLTTLAEFTAAGPRLPQGGLLAGPDGKLYGTTSAGGAADAGTVFQVVTATGSWSVVGEFTGSAGAVPGAGPVGSLALDGLGGMVGMTSRGGAGNAGGVFRYQAGTGLVNLVEFSGAAGAAPGLGVVDAGGGFRLSGGLAVVSPGVLVGTVPGGGSGGGGVVFRLSQFTSGSFAAWAQVELGNAAAGALGDTDGDGIPHLLEYALGLNPSAADNGNGILSGRKIYGAGDERLSLILARDPTKPDVTLEVLAAGDLSGPWTVVASSIHGAPFSGAGYFAGDGPSPGIKSVEIRDVVPLTAAPKRFLRVRASF